MSISKRKIRCYTVTFFYSRKSRRKNNNKKENEDRKSKIIYKPSSILKLFESNFKKIQDTENIKMDIGNNKFCFLKEYNYENHIFEGVFCSAKTKHRPPLVDEKTLQERENPKKLTEGEEERTHFVMKIDDSRKDIVLFLESRNVGVTPQVITKYIVKLAKMLKKVRYEIAIIAKTDFIRELEKLKVVKVCEIYAEKQIIGSDALNFSDVSEDMQEEVVIAVKAKRSKSIKDRAIEIGKKFINGADERIRKIRVIGLDNDKNSITVNTAVAQVEAYIESNLDEETKIVNSEDLLEKMKEINCGKY